MAMARAVWHVLYNGRLYEPGSDLPVEGDALKRLVESGAAMLPEPVEIEMPVEEQMAAPEPPAMPKAGRRDR